LFFQCIGVLNHYYYPSIIVRCVLIIRIKTAYVQYIEKTNKPGAREKEGNRKEKEPMSRRIYSNIKTCALVVLLVFVGLTTTSSFTPSHRGNSRFFLDTADTNEWNALLPSGIFHGVTCNPTLLERASEPCTVDNLHRLADLALSQCNEFMCQAWGDSVQELVDVTRQLAAKDVENIVVKLPITQTGLEAANVLIRQDNIRICMTACYARKQALLAAAVGAEYIAPYLGRMTDAGKDGQVACVAMNEIVGNGLQSDTRILVASLRQAETLAELARSGLDTFTFSPDIAQDLLFDEMTQTAAADFEEAAKRNQ